MTAADRARALGSQFSRSAAKPDDTRLDDDPAPRSSDAPTVRTKRIRRSVDLPVDRHYRLEEWCTEASRDLGFKVAGMAVINALVAELLTDEALADRVRARRDPNTGDLELQPHRASRRSSK